MGKIGDLWVNLRLKKDEFDKGLSSAKKGVYGLSGTFSKIGKLGAGAFGAIAGAAVAMGQQLIANTNKFGDAWARTMQGAKNGWQTFLSSIAQGNFKSLWKRMSDSFGAGREEADARDRLFEMSKASELARAQIQGDLDELYLDIYNTALPPEVRKAAIAKYKALLAPIYEAEKTVTKQVMDASIKSWLAVGNVSGVSQSDVIEFFKKVGLDPSSAMDSPLYAAYNSMGDGMNGKVFDAITAYMGAVSGLENEMKRMNKQSNMLDGLIGDEETIEEVREALPAITREITALAEAIDTNTPDIISKEWLEQQEERGQALLRQMEAIASAADLLDRSLENGLVNGLDELADAFAGVEGSNAGTVLKAILSPLADAAVSAGLLILTAGEGIEAFKESLSSLNGTTAIVAGSALIALGAAAKVGLAAIGRGGRSSGNSYTSATATTAGDVQTSELTVYVKGQISGSDIVLSYDRQKAKWRR